MLGRSADKAAEACHTTSTSESARETCRIICQFLPCMGDESDQAKRCTPPGDEVAVSFSACWCKTMAMSTWKWALLTVLADGHWGLTG
eukprot:1641411-Alexandrium_andersonii.AAC.1